jgi:hypothetical protein
LKLIEWFESGEIELYDLSDDAEEQKNIIHQRPQLADSLRTMMHLWQTEIGANMPKPNPNWTGGE